MRLACTLCAAVLLVAARVEAQDGGVAGADAGVADAGVADASVADAAVADASVADAAVADASVADAAAPVPDALPDTTPDAVPDVVTPPAEDTSDALAEPVATTTAPRRPVEIPTAQLGPSPGAARGYQYGLQFRYGIGHHHDVDVDATSVQLELLFPFLLEGFLTPHVGASWGNFGRPAAAHASRAWTLDFGLTFSWILFSWDSYVFHEQSLFNIELGVDLGAIVQEMRTASAAGGVADVQADFLIDLRPMVRFVAMIDRHVSVYVGLSLSYYDLTGRDDFIHGAEVSHRPSQLFVGVQLNPQGRVTRQ